MAATVCFLAVAGCKDQSPPATPLHVGVILSQTGTASFLGQPEAAVLNALVKDESDVVLDIRDSGGDANIAQTLFDSLAADTAISVVIGPSTSGESLQLAPRADGLHLALLSLAANSRIVLDANGATRPYVFKFAQNDDLAADRLAQVMKANGDTVAAMLYSDDAFGAGGAQAFRSAAGATIRLTSDVSYAAQLASADALAAQVAASNAVIIWGTTPGPALIVKALRTRGYTKHIYLSHGDASESFLQEVAGAAEGAYLVGSRVLISDDLLVSGRPADDAIRAYHTLWTSIATGAPSTFGGHARDALEAIRAAANAHVRGLASSARRQALRDGIEALSQFPGVTGTFTFSANDHAGLKPDAFELYRIQNGKFVAIP